MKKTIAILVIGVLPAMAQASGGHEMERMEHGGANHMHGMSTEAHEAAAGRPGDPARVNRTIKVSMRDTMRFEPAEMQFKKGETVRFVIRNDGRIRHEMVIGTLEELREHAEMMRKMPGMKHEESNMITLAPGEQGELIWRFDNAGMFDFACLIPGHLEAGMKGKIAVK